jgi:hypothetical protein
MSDTLTTVYTVAATAPAPSTTAHAIRQYLRRKYKSAAYRFTAHNDGTVKVFGTYLPADLTNFQADAAVAAAHPVVNL